MNGNSIENVAFALVERFERINEAYDLDKNKKLFLNKNKSPSMPINLLIYWDKNTIKYEEKTGFLFRFE